MSKITLSNLSDLNNANTVITTINTNNTTLQTAIDNTLSRDGTSPNVMNSQLDMNSNKIINVGTPTNGNDAARLEDVLLASGDPTALNTATTAAAASATAAASSQTAAATSATNAATSATNAATSATSASTSATSAAAALASFLGTPVWSNIRLAKSANYTLASGDVGKTIALSGSNITLSVSAASGYTTTFMCVIVNESTTRGQTISISGYSNFILYPLQSFILFNQNNVWQIGPQFQRYAPSAGVVFFVDPTGSDSNDGLAAGASGAFLNIQHAVDVIRSSTDRRGAQPAIHLSDGTHNVGGGVNVNYQGAGTYNLLILGNAGTPANVIVQCSGGGNCFNVRDGAVTVTLQGMTLSTIGNGSSLLSVSQQAVCDLINVNFNAAPLGTHVSVSTAGSSNFLGNYSINGGAAFHINCTNNSFINYGSFTATGAAGMAFIIFAVTTNCGVITAGGVPMNFSGFSGCTGQKYAAQANGVLATSGTVFPGDSAGSTATGGIYS